jgi:hypothetical protein
LVRPQAAVSTELADQWRRLTRAATVVALLTSPALFIWFKQYNGWSTLWSLLATLGVVIVFRGFADLIFRKLIPWPSLFGADSQQLRDEDVIGRRRAWYWRKKARFAIVFGTVITVVWLIRGGTWWGTVADMLSGLVTALSNPAVLTQVVFVTFLFIANFAILMGPMLLMGISQIRGFEPGDAQWGVKLEDVRGQVEAKEEVRRVVTLWQSGEAFERAGGKRERGLLFLGAPGTGKTMLAKAIATGFNSPFVSIPGSGFAQTFIGVDAIVVRYLAWKAKRLASKWGGQCIVFIDEIDAVGMRRQALGGGAPVGAFGPPDIHDHLFFGPSGAQIWSPRAARAPAVLPRSTGCESRLDSGSMCAAPPSNAVETHTAPFVAVSALASRPTSIVTREIPVSGSTRSTVPSRRFATQTEPKATTTASGPLPTGISLTISNEPGSSRTTLAEVVMVIQTDPSPTATPAALPGSWISLVSPVSGSMRSAVASNEHATQTAPCPVATPTGPSQTSIVLTTSFVSGLICETVGPPALVTQTNPSPTAIAEGSGPTRTGAITAPAFGSNRLTPPSSGRAIQTASWSAAIAPRRVPSGTDSSTRPPGSIETSEFDSIATESPSNAERIAGMPMATSRIATPAAMMTRRRKRTLGSRGEGA